MTDKEPDTYADLPPVASVDEWAQILGCHPQTVRRAIDSGQIRAVRLGRLIRIPRHSVIAWLHGQSPGEPGRPRS